MDLRLRTLAALVAAPLLVPTAQSQSELLISEIVVTPTGGEYVEIFNPNPFVVELSDVYLTDATFAGSSTYYYNVVTGACQDGNPATDCDAGGGGFSDFHARFPAGSTIAPGQYQTVALAGSDAFSAEYGVMPTYELYEDGAAADAVRDMVEAFPGSINDQGGLTNSGEMTVLYYWNGASDLVTDLDYVLWGDQAEAVDKSGVAIDGPDPGNATSTYNNEVATSGQAFLTPHAAGESFARRDFVEGTETPTGGNGIDGEDETSEDFPATFAIGAPTPNNGSATAQFITTSFSDQRRIVHEDVGLLEIRVTLVTSNGQPTARPITVEFDRVGGDIDDADFADAPPFVRVLTFPIGTASGSQLSGSYTLVDDADDELTETANYVLSTSGPDAPDNFGLTSFNLQVLDNDGTAGFPGQLVISEIMYDPASSSDGTPDNDVEWIEIINTTGSEVPLLGYTLEDAGDGVATFTGGVLQPFDIAVVISDDITVNQFRQSWNQSGDYPIVQINFDAFSGLSNSPGATNEDLILRDELLDTIDRVNFDNEAPWPVNDDASSIYLNVPNSRIIANGAVLNDDGANWALSTVGVGGAYTNRSRGPFGGGDIGAPGLSNGDDVVPVEIAEPLQARLDGDAVVLTWATASETNNAYFEVLARRADAGDDAFDSIGQVEGAGTTSDTRTYALSASDLAPGSYRFRLRQVDLDGTAVIAGEVELAVELAASHVVSSVWPNPAAGSSRLSVAVAQEQEVTVTVYDALGRSVAVVLDGRLDGQSAREVALPDALSAGVYVVEVAGERFREVRRFTVVR